MTGQISFLIGTYSFPGIVFFPITRLKIPAQELSDFFWDGVAEWRQPGGGTEGLPRPRATARKIPFMYSFSGICAVSVPISTFMCLWTFLYIPRIGPQFSSSRIGRSKAGIYKSLTYKWILEIGTETAQFLFWEYLFWIVGIGLCRVLALAFLEWFPFHLSYLHEAAWRKFYKLREYVYSANQSSQSHDYKNFPIDASFRKFIDWWLQAFTWKRHLHQYLINAAQGIHPLVREC